MTKARKLYGELIEIMIGHEGDLLQGRYDDAIEAINKALNKRYEEGLEDGKESCTKFS